MTTTEPLTVPRSFADAVRAMYGETTGSLTLQRIVDLAPTLIPGCEGAAISLVVDSGVQTPAASGPIPIAVDSVQYAVDEGPCLDAIRRHRVYIVEDLSRDRRWPLFSARVVAETDVRSVLSLRLFLGEETLGSLNLYSAAVAAFGADSQASGVVFAAVAAMAMASVRERESAVMLRRELRTSTGTVETARAQALVADELQRRMVPELQEFPRIQAAVRYLPAVAGSRVGGDWYDAFPLHDGATALVMGDVAGHDLEAAVRMARLRSMLRALAVDRAEPPGELLRRLDNVSEHLGGTETVTCVYAQIYFPTTSGARLRFANAGHPPPLLVTAQGEAAFLESPEHTLLGSGLDLMRSSNVRALPAGSTLLLYTDGLVERRGEDIDEGLERLRKSAAKLAALPVQGVCDELVRLLSPGADDDLCLLAVRLP